MIFKVKVIALKLMGVIVSPVSQIEGGNCVPLVADLFFVLTL